LLSTRDDLSTPASGLGAKGPATVGPALTVANDMLQKVLLFLPLGLFVSSGGAGYDRAVAFGAGFAMSLLLETGEFFLRRHAHPGFSDLIVEPFGAWLGCLTVQRFQVFKQSLEQAAARRLASAAGGPTMNPREACKAVTRGVANLLVAPVLVVHWLKAPFLGRDRALEGSTELLSLLPGVVGQYLRRAFLAWTIESCHPSASIGFGTVFSKAGARLEANCYIGGHCHLGLVHVERDVLIASGVHITSGARMHGTVDLSKPIKDQAGVNTRVTIGQGAWIGSLAVVMADVGRDSIIGAGAVVAKPIPERVVAAGVPARIVRQRDKTS
jgi:virginiamycin A acetyltransferase